MNHTYYPLGSKLPSPGETKNSGQLLDSFLEYVYEKKIDLYPAQEEAILALFNGDNVILNTPTGSGKSLVATAAHFYSVANGRRSYYTCPIKALVNEKFLALCKDFGPELVGMATGDATVNRNAPIICCTAEILSNLTLREGDSSPVEDVIMDEFHYYSDKSRGAAWQIPLLTLPYARFLLMSATLGDTKFFETALTTFTKKTTQTISSSTRPVPLNYVYKETFLHETIRDLVDTGNAPVYLVSFTQRECVEEAQNLMSIDVSSKAEKKTILEMLAGVKFSSPYGKDIQKFLKHGIGIHHAGLLPKYRLLVERLAQSGLLKVICGTDTLGVGVNIPIRTVLFSKLHKFDGEKSAILSVRDFLQISGRAGRKGFDESGTVMVLAPEHVIENRVLEQKAGGDPAKLRKITKKKPPERGYVPWDGATFNRLMTSAPEPLVSRFQVTHSMLLNILSRPGDGCRDMRRLLNSCHETPVAKNKLQMKAFQLFRSLVERKIIEFKDHENGGPRKRLQVNMNLQDEFALNQPLSLYLLDTIKLLDMASETYAVDVLSLVEAILENPDAILYKQVDRLKTIKMAEMKADGVEYEERIAELEKIENPKPNRDFIYGTFNKFAAEHPWVSQDNIKPKTIALEMYESFLSFNEYIKEYNLQRSEGVLLRHLSDVYKVLTQTVPEYARNEELIAVIDYFSTMIRGIDSSLLDEWERLKNLGTGSTRPQLGSSTSHDSDQIEIKDITRHTKAFMVMVRNESFRWVRALAKNDLEALAELHGEGCELPNYKSIWMSYYEDHREILTDRQARNPKHLQTTPNPAQGNWLLEQVVVDIDEANDWVLKLSVNLKASAEMNKAVLEFVSFSAIG